MAKILLITMFISQIWLGLAIAEEYTGPNRDENGNIVPKPLGEACIAPVDEMRRTHMSMLLHKRDKTVHDGIRSKKASLTECINCHATADEKGEVVRSDSDQYFCSSCHVAASVSIDCFECHTDRPASMFNQTTLK